MRSTVAVATIEASTRPRTEREAAALYETREAAFAAQCDRDTARSRAISNARLVAILTGVALAVLAANGRAAPLLWLASATALVLFVALVIGHARVEDRRAWHDALAEVNRLGRARLARDWNALPPPGPSSASTDHPYADDLDLFGHASLMQIVDTGTQPGRAMIASWLLAPSSPGVVRDRQAAVAALAPLVDVRQHIAAHGRLAARERPHDLEGFLSWAESAPAFLPRRWLVWSVWILTAAIWLGVAGHLVGLTSASAWLIPATMGAALSIGFARRVSGTFDRAFSRGRAFRRHAALFALICRIEAGAPLLVECQRRLCAGGAAADRIRRLDRLMALSDMRYAMALVHGVIQAATLWDFHVVFALERWQQSTGPQVRAWFDALGIVDALAAFATLAHDHPDWTLPEVDAGRQLVVSAAALAHPLLPGHVSVANDVTVGPAGTCLLVTGSNMSGKSTLLRAIGLNVILAQAGGPVAAAALRVPPVQVHTSMRVRDSLELGLSHFTAGLTRLRAVVAAAAAARETERPVLFLLDEVLSGTNSAERLVAVRTILARLVADGAIGAVTTHDLALATAPDVAALASLVHFTETVDDTRGGLRMSFDYRLRPGLATSRNALRLMALMGIDTPRQDAAD
jgi:hypothetical protein